MQNRFAGRVAIVTGAADGIGAAVVQRFLDEGAKVVTVDLAPHHPQQESAGDRLVHVQGDVRLEETAKKAVEKAISSFGQLDILINNAGVSDFAPIEEMTDDIWERHYEVNVRALLYLTRAAVGHLEQSDNGRVVITSSISALKAVPNHSAYSSSKAAAMGLSRALAVELGPKSITVNAVLPGPVLTTMLRELFEQMPEKEQELGSVGVLGRVALPEEIAGAVLFLASADAGFISGHGLVVDGGAMARL